ncbi:Methionyl-tRNA formyltransferase [Candidatus Zixiibacteriota bacterium]|nr:Methionyl-tRNA formyltransferase [candidate division Zixibacteria bacterium]
MKVVFMGTPEFARRPLEHLYKNTGHDVVAVITGPDKPTGRGQKLTPTPVKETALALDIPVLTPDSLGDSGFLEKISLFRADIFVVVAFRILPEALFSIPRHGSINLHGSLLPKYRGAAPINWALINGETETGLSTFFLKKKVDTGDLIYQEKIAIGPEETFDELYLRMSTMAGPVLGRTLDLIESGRVTPIRQDNSLATPAPKLAPYDCTIDWGFPALNVINFIRGLSSVPGAFTYFRGKKLKILRAKPYSEPLPAKYEPGQIIPGKRRLLTAVAAGAVEITELVPEGKAKITGAEFVRGYRPEEREMLSAR